MPQVINTNIASLNAQRNLNASQADANVALQRLSSGLRINSAKDDAAGLAISERFQSQIAGLNQAQRNANDGISLAQTAEGAMDEITNNLQRIRELAVQSANATNSISDRQALNQEVQQRIEEINRIASQTSFNGLKVLDGTFATQTFQVGANTGETIALSGLDSRGSQIGSVLKETAGLGGFIVEEGVATQTPIELSEAGFNFNGTDSIDGSTVINGIPITIPASTPANEGALAATIQQAIDDAITADVDGAAEALEGITVDADGSTLIFSNARTEQIQVSLALEDNTGSPATTVSGLADTPAFANGTGDLFSTAQLSSITTETYDGTVSFNIGGTDYSVDLTTANAGGPVTSEAEFATAINSELSGITDLSVAFNNSAIEITNSGTGTFNISGVVFTANDAVANNSLNVSENLEESVPSTLIDQFEAGNAFNFNVDINGTLFSFEGVGSLNDIVSQVNAESNDTGIKANLNADNTEIFFSSQFGEAFTIDIQADLDSDGIFDAATETVQSVVATSEIDTISMNDIDISTREGADLAMIAVDYAIDSINGYRAELGAVQNRFESTIANLSTTSENLSASNSRIRDADFAAETAELARTQVLQSAGLSVLAQANARPQQVLQLLQG